MNLLTIAIEPLINFIKTNLLTIFIALAIIGSVMLTLVLAWQNRSRLPLIIGKDDKWNFNSWAKPLTSTATCVSVIFALLHKDPTITSLSLLCGSVIALTPTAFNAVCGKNGLFKNGQRVWAFLFFTTITLSAVVSQFVAAAVVASDDIITQAPPGILSVFRWIMVIGIVTAVMYYLKSTARTLKEQTQTSVLYQEVWFLYKSADLSDGSDKTEKAVWLVKHIDTVPTEEAHSNMGKVA